MQEFTQDEYVVAAFAIHDHNERETIRIYSATQNAVKVAGLFATGTELLRALEQGFYPHVLVLDPFVNDMGIFELVRNVRALVGHDVHIAVLCTEMNSRTEMKAMLTCGVDYIMLKPCTLAKMFSDICMLAQKGAKIGPGVLRTQFSNMLSQAGVSRRLYGCNYVQQMVLYALREDPDATIGQLYQVVADAEKVSVGAVTAAVRRMSRAMQKNMTNLYQQMCIQNGKSPKESLTNSELIKGILEHIGRELQI